MQIAVCIRGAIIVDDNVDTLNVNATAEDISRNKYTFFKCFERGIAIDTGACHQISRDISISWVNLPFLLGQTRVDTNTGEVARDKQFVQFNATCNRLDEDDDLANHQ
jgi:hypothetical protein